MDTEPQAIAAARKTWQEQERARQLAMFCAHGALDHVTRNDPDQLAEAMACAAHQGACGLDTPDKIAAAADRLNRLAAAFAQRVSIAGTSAHMRRTAAELERIIDQHGNGEDITSICEVAAGLGEQVAEQMITRHGGDLAVLVDKYGDGEVFFCDLSDGFTNRARSALASKKAL